MIIGFSALAPINTHVVLSGFLGMRRHTRWNVILNKGSMKETKNVISAKLPVNGRATKYATFGVRPNGLLTVTPMTPKHVLTVKAISYEPTSTGANNHLPTYCPPRLTGTERDVTVGISSNFGVRRSILSKHGSAG
jgi:hypothetical protein